MDKQTIRFVSQNEHKLREAKEILSVNDVQIADVSARIEEIQSKDIELIVRDKVTRAFDQIGRPLFVEQTGLYLQQLNGLPGGLTQVFWDALEAEQFARLFGRHRENGITAKTMIGYTDGRRINIFEGEVSGTIASNPRGPREFQWDCIFVPDGYTETFAEMGEKKNEISMRRKALNEFVTFLGAT